MWPVTLVPSVKHHNCKVRSISQWDDTPLHLARLGGHKRVMEIFQKDYCEQHVDLHYCDTPELPYTYLLHVIRSWFHAQKPKDSLFLRFNTFALKKTQVRAYKPNHSAPRTGRESCVDSVHLCARVSCRGKDYRIKARGWTIQWLCPLLHPTVMVPLICQSTGWRITFFQGSTAWTRNAAHAHSTIPERKFYSWSHEKIILKIRSQIKKLSAEVRG